MSCKKQYRPDELYLLRIVPQTSQRGLIPKRLRASLDDEPARVTAMSCLITNILSSVSLGFPDDIGRLA